MSKALAGKHVVVVGASSGMGRAVAIHAAAAGATLTLVGRDPARLQPVAEETGGADIRVADLRDAAAIPAALAGVARADHLVVTAGTYGTGKIADTGPDDWRQVLEERLIGPLVLIKTLAPVLTTSVTLFTGSIVRRASVGSVLATAALGGVEAAVRALAIELAPIRVNAVAPGMIDTPMLDAVLGDRKAAAVAAQAARLPTRRIGTPDDAAAAAMFLISNPFITGTTIELDGGATLI